MMSSPIPFIAASIAIRNIKGGGGGKEPDPPPENPKILKWLIGISVVLFLSSIGVFAFGSHPLLAIILSGASLAVIVGAIGFI